MIFLVRSSTALRVALLVAVIGRARVCVIGTRAKSIRGLEQARPSLGSITSKGELDIAGERIRG